MGTSKEDRQGYRSNSSVAHVIEIPQNGNLSESRRIFTEQLLPTAKTSQSFWGDMQLTSDQSRPAYLVTFWANHDSLESFLSTPSVMQMINELGNLGAKVIPYKVTTINQPTYTRS